MGGNRKLRKFDVAGAIPLSAIVLTCALLVSSARAVPIRVGSEIDPTIESAFTLDFGELGDIDGMGPLRTGTISRTDMEVEVDPDTGFARLTRYEQDVAPLILPGGFDTGNIRVELVRGSSIQGTFDRLTGEFVTEDEFAIYFEGDLSAFGLTSPVFLPSLSAGVVSLSDLTLGSVVLDWAGETVIGSGANALPLTYFCVVNNRFEPDAGSLLGLGLGPAVLSLDLPAPYGRRLFDLTQLARRALRYNSNSLAKAALLGFVERVEDGVGALVIDPADGANLIFDAEFANELIPGSQGPWMPLKRRRPLR